MVLREKLVAERGVEEQAHRHREGDADDGAAVAHERGGAFRHFPLAVALEEPLCGNSDCQVVTKESDPAAPAIDEIWAESLAHKLGTAMSMKAQANSATAIILRTVIGILGVSLAQNGSSIVMV